MVRVGDVLGIHTKNVINKDSAFKWHFCVCSKNRLYLYICGRGYHGDFHITDDDCSKLEYKISYISLSRLIHVPDWRMKNSKAKHACTVSDEFLRKFWLHVAECNTLSERDRSLIIAGLERHFRPQQA